MADIKVEKLWHLQQDSLEKSIQGKIQYVQVYYGLIGFFGQIIPYLSV